MFEIRVLGGIPGSGKTMKMRDEMVGTTGKYIYASTRIDLIKERLVDLNHAAKAAGTNPVLKPIHGENRKSKIGSVLRRIRDVSDDHRHDKHVIVLITHEGLIGADWSG